MIILHGIQFAQSCASLSLRNILNYVNREGTMRKTKFFEMQNQKASEMKRLRELEKENSLLKLLYADLLQKFSEMKDGLTRSTGVC